MLKIFASSLNLAPTPSPGKIFNAHPLDFLNANFHVPEVYCFAAHAACNIMIWPRFKMAFALPPVIAPTLLRRLSADTVRFEFARLYSIVVI